MVPHRRTRTAQRRRRFLVLSVVTVMICIVAGSLLIQRRSTGESKDFAGAQKEITLSEEGMVYGAFTTNARTVGEYLEESDIQFQEGEVFPDPQTALQYGTNITIQRSKEVQLTVEGEDRIVRTGVLLVQQLLHEQDIDLTENDLVLPSLYTPISNNMNIQVIRVVYTEERVIQDIPFVTKIQEDDDMGWQEKKVVQKGVQGKKEKIYTVTYHDQEEIDRKLIEEKIVEQPTNEIITQGTYVKLGKKHTGWGTWYAHTGTMAAASPWLPMGSHAKVTNRDNGKSVIVVINDRGPFGENRIIDLDKVAFEKIASLGAGVIDVKVEEILN